MESVASITQRLQVLRNGATLPVSRAFDAQQDVDDYNNSVGDMTGYDCGICRNKGYIAVNVDGRMIMQPCKCIPVRTAARLIKQSGIRTTMTLQDFKAAEPWQKNMFDVAERFLSNTDGWLYAGGQVGCGKTMICTAIVNELLKRLIPCRYMLWRDDVVRLKASVNVADEYRNMIEPLKRVPVLYIDDFFKTEQGKPPTQADVNIAFEIINFRYNNPNLITLISSERTVIDLLEIDEAVGSRIYQRTKNFNISIAHDNKKNYRLK